jgi:two-component system KDP operon response regulator KdpE
MGLEMSNKPPGDKAVPHEQHPFNSDTPLEASHATAGANRKILIVDDNPLVLKAFQLKLKSCGFNVIAVADPSEGIKAARHEMPVAVILDLHFRPGRNVAFSSMNWSGLHILQWLKHYKEVADIPIIVLTVDDPGESKEHALAAGAAAFFQKPVELKTFLAELLKLIGDKPGA